MINSTNPESNAWAQLESSSVSVDEFDEIFAQEAEHKGYSIRGKQVLELLSGELRPEMVNALTIIKRSHRIGCITNNVKSGEGPGMAGSEEKAQAVQGIMDMFWTWWWNPAK